MNRTTPTEGVDYQRLAGGRVRCLLGKDGRSCTWSAAFRMDRLKEHYQGGPGRSVKACEFVSSERRARFRETDLAEDRFVPVAAGYERYERSKTCRFQHFYAHDARCANVQCLYCGRNFKYNVTRMLMHIIGGSTDIVPCQNFPDEFKAEFTPLDWTGEENANRAARAFAQALMAETGDRELVMKLYYSKAVRALMVDLAALPSVKHFHPPPFDEAVPASMVFRPPPKKPKEGEQEAVEDWF